MQRSISLQRLFWVSMLSIISMLRLGLNAFLHFNSFLAERQIWPSQSMREVEICLYPPGRDRFGGVRWKSVPSRLHSRMWCHHVIGRDGWEWGEQGTFLLSDSPHKVGEEALTEVRRLADLSGSAP